MKVLRIQPKKYPEVIEIDGSLESLQKEVAGPIQVVYPWDDPVALICNEEGKLAEDSFVFPVAFAHSSSNCNRVLYNEIGIPYDIVVGTFLIVGLTEDDFGDLSQELIQRYEKLFHNPEEFDYFTDAQGRTHLDVRPCEPEDNAK